MSQSIEIYDERIGDLSESPVWNSGRQSLFWVDIPKQQLLSRSGDEKSSWSFAEMLSAIALVDDDHLLIAFESGLYLFEIDSGIKTLVCELESDQSTRRSNDGRADPWGGFWVSTMDKSAAQRQGAIYRWYRGEIRQLVTDLSIPNGICFDFERARAYYADSLPSMIFSIKLDLEHGWPVEEANVFLDLSDQNCDPDGAVIDEHGCMWVAQWDAHCVVRYSPEAQELSRITMQTPRPTCPAFGGPDFRDLFVTTAAIGLGSNGLHGKTYVMKGVARGAQEPRVKLCLA